MADVTVALLHPGEMGAEVGACARAAGLRVVWASEGRGQSTRQRAAAAGLADLGTLGASLEASDVVLSICPPHAALDVARAVAARGFRGLYVDANAVSPATTQEVGRIVEAAGATFVDGGIVGPPPTAAGVTRLYLSGKGAERVSALFAGSHVEAVALDGPIGAASALKACYAGWNKGATALIAAVRAVAAHAGVERALADEWSRSQPDAVKRSEGVRGSARKAWRWIAEMEEIAATFAAAGQPDGFHRAAADIYRKLDRYKDAPGLPALDEIVGALTPPDRPPARR
jgi:3-hydroxyisobutyrate dehydrogenase-like beta-hydroxyacid dehydrogenase